METAKKKRGRLLHDVDANHDSDASHDINTSYDITTPHPVTPTPPSHSLPSPQPNPTLPPLQPPQPPPPSKKVGLNPKTLRATPSYETKTLRRLSCQIKKQPAIKLNVASLGGELENEAKSFMQAGAVHMFIL